MKNLTIKSMLAMLIAVSVVVSCQKDQYETAAGQVFSSKYTNLTLDDNFDLPNPATSEQYAVKLFDLKEDAGGLTEKELLSIGDPARNEDLLYALLFVEKYNRDEILWSWLEPKDDETVDRSGNAQWKWTGGNPIASMYASGFKKWPAYKVKNIFQDPCGDIIQAGPVYQACHKLCDDNLPPVCMTDEIKKSILEKIIADTPVDPYSIAKQLVQQSNWPLQANVNLPTTPVTLMNYERQVISGDIVHYKFEIALSAEPHDKIGIHRVVKETAPNVPVVTDKAVFFQHGDGKDFTGIFQPGLYSSNMPDDFGVAFYMAENNVDVWGIDQPWTLLPEGITEFTFMADWGLEKNFTDLRSGMAIARVARFLTSDNLEKMNLVGYSSGVHTAIALLNHETQLPEAIRHAKGCIPIDQRIKTDDIPFQQYRYQGYLSSKADYDNGTYQSISLFRIAGLLAENDPDGNSPIVPGLTNLQTALFAGCSNQLFGPTTYHFLSGIWVNNFPTELRFLTLNQWIDFLKASIYNQPKLFEVDRGAMESGIVDNLFDDYFSQIKVPILNVSPAGGNGDKTKYGISLLGSTDVTHHIPSLLPPNEVLYDFGHIDIFIANNAETVMWKPMLDWIKAH